MPGIVAPAAYPPPITMNKAMVIGQGPEDDPPGFGLPFLAPSSSSSATTPGLDVFWAHPAEDARYYHGRYLRGPAERACVTPEEFWSYASIHDVSVSLAFVFQTKPNQTIHHYRAQACLAQNRPLFRSFFYYQLKRSLSSLAQPTLTALTRGSAADPS